MKTERFSHRSEQGLTLIELMIAMVIGLFITAGVMAVFLGSRKSFHHSEYMARVQENGRFAIDAIGNELRMISYSGCGSIASLRTQSLVSGQDNLFDDSTVVSGRAYAAGDPVAGSNGVTGSDIVTVRYLSQTSARLAQPMAQKSDPVVLVKTATTPKFSTGQIVAIANCQNMDIFQATSAAEAATTITLGHAAGANTSGELSTRFQLTDIARINRLIEETFYVAKTGNNNSSGQPIYGLYRQATLNGTSVAGSPAELLAEGIDNMRLRYGTDNNGDGAVDGYVAVGAMTSTTWSNTMSARVELLVASTDEVLSAPAAYTFDGTTTTPADRKLRTSFGATVTLRNRVHQQ